MSRPPPGASTASPSARRCWRTRASTPCWAGACSSRPSACSAQDRSSCAAPTISSQMSEADRKQGAVGWSSGNHAQGLAEAARLMGMKATIVMPADAPALKVANTRASGSLCGALLAPTPGDVTFPLAQQLLGPGLVVTDDEVLDAMETAFREFKLVVEPGGAVTLAAALTGKLPVKGRAVAVVCSGGNVDHETFRRALARPAP